MINERKLQHLRILESDHDADRQGHYFDAVRLSHRALPEIARDAVDPGTVFLGKRLSFPLLMSSMTGGHHELLQRINRNLAAAAETCGVAMSVGSQRVMFAVPEARASFALRDVAPRALLLANLGAVQLNEGFGLPQCRAAVAVLEADGLYLHLNPLQEAVQPEGDTDFTGLAAKIGALARDLESPVLLKEVGAGLSLADGQLAIRHGIRYLDVAGTGGTSWSRIEHHRQADSSRPHDLGLLFQDWGIPTPQALRLLAPLRPQATLIASGGIRNGLDMAKALVLGASLCGLAKPFLLPAIESVGAVVQVIERLRREFVTAMFLLGCRNVGELQGNESLLL